MDSISYEKNNRLSIFDPVEIDWLSLDVLYIVGHLKWKEISTKPIKMSTVLRINERESWSLGILFYWPGF